MSKSNRDFLIFMFVLLVMVALQVWIGRSSRLMAKQVLIAVPVEQMGCKSSEHALMAKTFFFPSGISLRIGVV